MFHIIDFAWGKPSLVGGLIFDSEEQAREWIDEDGDPSCMAVVKNLGFN